MHKSKDSGKNIKRGPRVSLCALECNKIDVFIYQVHVPMRQCLLTSPVELYAKFFKDLIKNCSLLRKFYGK